MHFGSGGVVLRPKRADLSVPEWVVGWPLTSHGTVGLMVRAYPEAIVWESPKVRLRYGSRPADGGGRQRQLRSAPSRGSISGSPGVMHASETRSDGVWSLRRGQGTQEARGRPNETHTSAFSVMARDALICQMNPTGRLAVETSSKGGLIYELTGRPAGTSSFVLASFAVYLLSQAYMTNRELDLLPSYFNH